MNSRSKQFYVFDPKYEKYAITVVLGFFFGLFSISFVIWNRLLRERLPRDLIHSNTTMLGYFILCWICLMLFLSCISLAIKTYKAYYGIEKRNKYLVRILDFISRQTLLRDISNFWSWYIISAHEYIIYYFFLYYFIQVRETTADDSKIRNRIIHLIDGILRNIGWNTAVILASRDYEDFLWRHRVTFFFFSFLPRLICFTILCYEVLVDQYIESFYHYAILLLIPYVFKLFYTISHMHAKVEIAYMEHHIVIDRRNSSTYIDTDEQLHIELSCYSKQHPQHSDDNFFGLVELHWMHKNILRTMRTFKKLPATYMFLGLQLGLTILLLATFVAWGLILYGINPIYVQESVFGSIYIVISIISWILFNNKFKYFK